eukprot:1347166-Pyramimonas_sp.AAC.1
MWPRSRAAARSLGCATTVGRAAPLPQQKSQRQCNGHRAHHPLRLLLTVAAWTAAVRRALPTRLQREMRVVA